MTLSEIDRILKVKGTVELHTFTDGRRRTVSDRSLIREGLALRLYGNRNRRAA